MEYLPNVPFPGHFIREELDARGWSQRDLAWLLGVPEQSVTMIISGKRGVSPEMAKALGDAFDVNPDFFANLQRAYDMSFSFFPMGFRRPKVAPLSSRPNGWWLRGQRRPHNF